MTIARLRVGGTGLVLSRYEATVSCMAQKTGIPSPTPVWTSGGTPPLVQVGGADLDDDILDSENDEELFSSSNIALFEAIGIIEGVSQESNISAGSNHISSAEIDVPDIEDFFPSPTYLYGAESDISEPNKSTRSSLRRA